jgi:predicted ATPase
LAPPTLAPQLRRHTGGNPLFVLETLRHMVIRGCGEGEAEGGLPRPASVEQLITRRLLVLSAPARELTHLMAVADTAFCVAMAEVVLGRPAVRLADAWRELEAAHIVRGTQFAHDLVSSAARAGLADVVAQRLHAQVADWLLAHQADPALVAHHRERAGDPAAAATAYLRAAEQARAASRHDDEVAMLTHALQHLQEAADATVVFDARCNLAAAVRVSQGALAALQLTQTFGRRPRWRTAGPRLPVGRANRVGRESGHRCGDTGRRGRRIGAGSRP